MNWQAGTMLHQGRAAQRAPDKSPRLPQKRSKREPSPPRGNQAANTAQGPSTTWVSSSGWHQRSITIVFPAVKITLNRCPKNGGKINCIMFFHLGAS